MKAWEPPLAELLDWLGELRAALGDGAPIFVLPVAEAAGGAPALAAGTRRADLEPRPRRAGRSVAVRRHAGDSVSGAPTFAVVGHPNKGKSSIVSTLAQDDSVRIAPEPGTTTECRAYPMRVDGEVQYVLVDTPGFQRARRALDWMRARETHAGAHRAVVEAFVAEHRGTGRFPDECELLTPVLAGAGILYVADGARPYGPDFEAEMEILRWTGQPSMALINPIGGDAHVEEWRAALSQYFKIVRVFDAHAATFEARLDLLRGFGQLSEEWRAPLEAAVAAIAAGARARARARRARARGAARGQLSFDARRAGSPPARIPPTSASRSSTNGRRRCARASARRGARSSRSTDTARSSARSARSSCASRTCSRSTTGFSGA